MAAATALAHPALSSPLTIPQALFSSGVEKIAADVIQNSCLITAHRKVQTTRCSAVGASLGRIELDVPIQLQKSRLFRGRLRQAPCKRKWVRRTGGENGLSMRAAVSTGPPSHGFDYYELLGLDLEADAAGVKQAYRHLQKKCHPDVAGDGLGHEMAVLLNEAYTVLSDPHARAAYDQGRALWIDDEAFTGMPLHSTWHGPKEEDRAVFVDENACVGCLQCALIASNTFAIESKHGRARCIKQWGDEEGTIQAAVAACPVDCIRLVERSKLPALEFVMARQPRVAVGVDVHSGGGKRSVDVFQAADKFIQKRAKKEKQKKGVMETPAQKEARQRAAEAIYAQQTNGVGLFSLRWWMGPTMAQAVVPQQAGPGQTALVELSPEAKLAAQAAAAAAARKSHLQGDKWHALPDSVRKLYEAASQRAGRPGNRNWESVLGADMEEYWRPMAPISCPVVLSKREVKKEKAARPRLQNVEPLPQHFAQPTQRQGWWANIPAAVGVVGAAIVALTYETEGAQSATTLMEAPELHTLSRLMVALSDGLWPRALLAGVAWYVAAAVAASLYMLATAAVAEKEMIQEVKVQEIKQIGKD